MPSGSFMRRPPLHHHVTRGMLKMVAVFPRWTQPATLAAPPTPPPCSRNPSRKGGHDDKCIPNTELVHGMHVHDWGHARGSGVQGAMHTSLSLQFLSPEASNEFFDAVEGWRASSSGTRGYHQRCFRRHPFFFFSFFFSFFFALLFFFVFLLLLLG